MRAAVAVLRRAAIGALQSGDVEAAIGAYRSLVAADPTGADDWYNLGYLYRCARRFDEALLAYATALTRGISDPAAVHVNRAAIYADHLADDGAAERELRAALDADGGFLIALLNLANLYEDRGDRKAARATYDRAIAIAPDNGRAVARRAMLGIEAGDAARVAEELRERLRTTRFALDGSGEIGFALGHALDAIGDYDAAFAAFAIANRESRAAAASSVPAYDPVAHARLIDRIIAAFPLPAIASAQPDAADGPVPPLFVCGMFRSGSTLAEQMLSRHHRITAGGELELLPALVATRLRPFPEAAGTLSRARRDELRNVYLDDLDRLFPQRDLVTDKRPDNYLYIGLIKQLFPSAKIVHTVRQPLDNALSIYFLNFDPSISYGFDLASIADYYRQYRRLMAHWRHLYSDDIVEADYDLIVESPEPELRALIAGLGLDWDPACLDHEAGGGAVVRTASTWQVRQPLHGRSSGRWRHYDRHLSALRA